MPTQFETKITPRFCETDALKHISNTVFPVWFEAARAPLFFNVFPEFTVENWPMILAHIDIDFLDQVFLGEDVIVNVYIKKVGTKSVTIFHEATQHGKAVAQGSAVLVYFDFEKHESKSIPDEMKSRLVALL